MKAMCCEEGANYLKNMNFVLVKYAEYDIINVKLKGIHAKICFFYDHKVRNFMVAMCFDPSIGIVFSLYIVLILVMTTTSSGGLKIAQKGLNA